MRVNIYAEEITQRVALVCATVPETNSTFHGVRFYLKTHEDMLPPIHPDDDSSGVTFWVKSGKKGYSKGDEKELLAVLRQAVKLLEECL